MAITLEKLKKAEINKMSFDDIFLSDKYKSDLEGIMKAACLRVNYRKPVKLKVFSDEQDEDIAYTDGNTIYINFGTNFATRLKEKPVLFHIFNVGLLAHELGHIFWTDFDDGEKYMKSLKKGNIYPSVPVHPNAQKFTDALSNKYNNKILCELCHAIDNILEDIYVNALQRQMLGGLYAQGINLGNTMIAENAYSIEVQKEKHMYDSSIIINCLLTGLKCNAVYYGRYESEYSDVVERIDKIARDYIFKKTHTERVVGINLIICEMWDYIADMLTNIKQKATPPQNKNSTQNSGSNDDEADCSSSVDGADCSSSADGADGLSSAEIDEAAFEEGIKEAIDQLQGKTTESKNQTTSNIAEQQTVDDGSSDLELNALLSKDLSTDKNGNKSIKPSSVSQAIEAEGNGSIIVDENYVPSGKAEACRTLSELVDEISTERAIEKNNTEIINGLLHTVEDIDLGPIHKNVNINIFRISTVPESYKYIYQQLLKEIKPIVDNLVKVIVRTIKEENLAGERRGRYYGKMLDNSRLYRPDLKVFKDRKNPKKEIDCVFYFLVDESGSMSGRKIEYSRLVSILFAEACERLGIPLEITGHTTMASGIALYNYRNFISVDKNDKYRLVDMSARSCNRDGAAIIYCCERLLKRPEKKKVFCIVSDGSPNDTGYSGMVAKSDLKHIKNKYSKEGITFVAAAIDEDKEYIKEIYGKNFLNISHLEDMPQTFGKILKNTVLDD